MYYNNENLIYSVDQISKKEIFFESFDLTKQFYQKVSVLFTKNQIEKIKVENNEIELKEEELKENIHHHLNKSLFEVDSLRIIIDLINGSGKIGKPQIKIFHVLKEKKREISVKELIVIKQLIKDFFFLLAETFRENSMKFQEKYEYSKRTTLELINFIQKWKIKLPRSLKNLKQYVLADFHILNISRTNKKILKIDEEGYFSFYRIFMANNFIKMNYFIGWKSVSVEITIEQRRLLFFELFLIFSESRIKKFVRHTNWNYIMIKGYMLTHPLFLIFKGETRWSNFNLLSTLIPKRHSKKLEQFMLQILIQMRNRKNMLKQVIKRICGIQTFFAVYYILQQFVRQRKSCLRLKSKISYVGQKCTLMRKGGNKFCFKVYVSLNSNKFYIYQRSKTRLIYTDSSNLQSLKQILYNID